MDTPCQAPTPTQEGHLHRVSALLPPNIGDHCKRDNMQSKQHKREG